MRRGGREGPVVLFALDCLISAKVAQVYGIGLAQMGSVRIHFLLGDMVEFLLFGRKQDWINPSH